MKLNVYCESRSSATLKRSDCLSTRHQGRLSEMKPVSGIEEVMPWGVFAAYAAALASTGFLLVLALTGGIYLG